MVTPEARREAVKVACKEHGMSERKASRLFNISSSVLRYKHRTDRNIALRKRLLQLAQKRRRWGCPLLFRVLKREGWQVNHKRVERLYRQENLALRRKKRGKKIVRDRKPLPVASVPNQRWALDFVHDSLWNGRRLRCLTIIDCSSRYSPAIKVGFSLSSCDVIRTLNQLAVVRGLPSVITLDNGPELTSKALAKWSQKHGVSLDFIEPGKPMQNGYCESFNGTFRHECLDANWFTSLSHARNTIEQWRNEYNQERPHGSLDHMTPEEVEIEYFNEKNQMLGTK